MTASKAKRLNTHEKHFLYFAMTKIAFNGFSFRITGISQKQKFLFCFRIFDCLILSVNYRNICIKNKIIYVVFSKSVYNEFGSGKIFFTKINAHVLSYVKIRNAFHDNPYAFHFTAYILVVSLQFIIGYEYIKIWEHNERLHLPDQKMQNFVNSHIIKLITLHSGVHEGFLIIQFPYDNNQQTLKFFKHIALTYR